MALGAGYLWITAEGGGGGAHARCKKGPVLDALPISGVQHAILGVEVDPCTKVHSSSEVNESQLALGREQDVLWLHIPVHDSQRVEPAQRSEQAPHDGLHDHVLPLLQSHFWPLLACDEALHGERELPQVALCAPDAKTSEEPTERAGCTLGQT